MKEALKLVDESLIKRYEGPKRGSLYFYEIIEDSLFKRTTLLMGHDFCSCPEYLELREETDGWATCEHRLAVKIAEGLGVAEVVVESAEAFKKRRNAFFGICTAPETSE